MKFDMPSQVGQVDLTASRWDTLLAPRAVSLAFPAAPEQRVNCTMQKRKRKTESERWKQEERRWRGAGDDAVNQIKWQLKCHSMPKHFKMQAACEKCSCQTTKQTTTTTTTIVCTVRKRVCQRLRLEMAMVMGAGGGKVKREAGWAIN